MHSSIKWNLYDLQCYILQRHYGGYYSKTVLVKLLQKIDLDSVNDNTKITEFVAEQLHWEEDPIDKILYFLKD